MKMLNAKKSINTKPFRDPDKTIRNFKRDIQQKKILNNIPTDV